MVTLSSVVVVPSGRALSNLRSGNLVEVTVSGQVTGGSNNAAGQQNGIMQFANDIMIASGGVLRVHKVEKLNGFATTRAALEIKQGSNGDRGIASLHGYTTSFAQGVTAAAPLYRVTFRAIGLGSTQVSFSHAAAPRLAASTPRGVKLGHTAQNGDPANISYPAALNITVTDATMTPGDWDADGDVDLADYAEFTACLTGPGGSVQAGCSIFNFDLDNDIDMKDFAAFARTF
jgi:hypothetical protein